MPSDKLFKGGVPIQGETYILKVSKDRLHATVTLKDHKENVPLDLALLPDELREQGIVHGVLPQPEHEPGGLLCVAKGIPAVPGENARVKFHVKPPITPPPPKGDELPILPPIVNVAKGKLLLEKVPFTEGTPGRDVFGDEIPAKPGKDRSLRWGKGTDLSEDGMSIFAELDGKFILEDGKPSVVGEHTVTGNVDLRVGNLAFAGSSLKITGEVLPGFSVKCRGDIVIQQGVNNASVMAGGNLNVSGGVVGDASLLRAKGDIVVDFVENGPKIESAASLYVNDFMLHAIVNIGGNVAAVKGKAAILGGKLIVAGSVHVRELGNEAGVTTDVSVGMIPSLQARKQALEEDIALWSDRLNEVLKNISTLERMKKEQGGKLDEEKATLLKKCQIFMPKAMEKVNALTEESNKITESLEQMVNEMVYVYDRLYPGVVVRIGSLARVITMEEDKVVVYFDKTSHQIMVRKMSREEQSSIPSY
ncbi:MAG: DUF342 domain-containing protein [Thermodesulfobacteriota bacterium]